MERTEDILKGVQLRVQEDKQRLERLRQTIGDYDATLRLLDAYPSKNSGRIKTRVTLVAGQKSDNQREAVFIENLSDKQREYMRLIIEESKAELERAISSIAQKYACFQPKAKCQTSDTPGHSHCKGGKAKDSPEKGWN